MRREQRVETWLDPGNRPWTVVGFAAVNIVFNKLEEGLEGDAGDDAGAGVLRREAVVEQRLLATQVREQGGATPAGVAQVGTEADGRGRAFK